MTGLILHVENALRGLRTGSFPRRETDYVYQVPLAGTKEKQLKPHVSSQGANPGTNYPLVSGLSICI